MKRPLPAGWREARLGFLVDTQVPQRDKPDPLTGPIPWVRIEDFDGQDIRASKSGQGVTPEQVHAMNLRVFEPGTVMCSCSCSMGATAIVREPLVSNQTFIGLKPGKELESRFLFYLMGAMREELQANATGAIQQYLSRDDFRSLRIPLPPPDEQRRIADFLDAETARIDTLTSAKERASALIDERRLALTSQMCLRGLDVTAPMRDTGIAPLGAVPAHWPIMRNKNFMREITDLSQEGNEELLTVSHLTGVTPRSEKTVYMFQAESMIGYKLCHPGDLVINTLWAWMGALGISRYEGIVSPAYGVYRFTSGEVLPEYFDLLFRTPEYVAEMTRYSKGVWTSRLRLYPESFLALRTPVPPLAAQKIIVDTVKRENAPGLKLQDAIRRSNLLLSERRQALITAAVTGQFDVYAASGRNVTEGVSA